MKTAIIILLLTVGLASAVDLTKDNLETVCQVKETEIECRNRNIETIAKDTFANYGAKIVNASFSVNQISKLEPGTFATLTSLRELDLDFNILSSIPADLFEPENNSLEDLNLGFNAFQSFNPDLLQGFPKITYLSLRSNKIKSVKSSPSSKKSTLETLILTDNEIESLDEGVMSSLVNLENLDINRNMITSIHPEFIGQENKLEKLDLVNNQLSGQLDLSAFKNLRYLSVLFLGSNQISSVIVSALFNNSLEMLDINNNKIESITDKSFQYLNRLFSLDLSNNLITKIEPGSFESNRINFLYLSGNKLETIEPGTLSPLFQRLSGYQLDLSKNNLVKIPANELYCSDFSVLNLCDNKLEYIDSNNCNDKEKIFSVWKKNYGYSCNQAAVVVPTFIQTLFLSIAFVFIRLL